MVDSSDRIAPEGQIWVCCACGKMSKDRNGPSFTHRMWDASCTLNSALFYTESLKLNKDGYVTEGTIVPEQEILNPSPGIAG